MGIRFRTMRYSATFLPRGKKVLHMNRFKGVESCSLISTAECNFSRILGTAAKNEGEIS